ncbi:MAG: bifunctional phosphoribosylaminoimidazolecarboxamide formyltransferase/IMP cyclohydrolase [Bacteroidales bacterium]|jgi:phosphoribosylaminoimidazolecarboxamide formyltransferase/IMP cyclohydrolase|nr:bifunctional phosphoribosylaminoimidazolecarboxamide formyltransferase/IMP cyclohydrolase [Bacteroidales bacterium]
MQNRKIKTALISVFNKEGLEPILRLLDEIGCNFISTGGTSQFIKSQGYKVTSVEKLTDYPSILGGRVKTLHPKIFGGILGRVDEIEDQEEMKFYEIEAIDLVIVDLYPFEDTVKNGASHADIIEKIDIGGISLIRAAAKNYKSVLIVSNKNQYQRALEVIKKGYTTEEERQLFAKEAFMTSSHYDTQIWNYFGGDYQESLKVSVMEHKTLRYGENPHQKGFFYGKLAEMFEIFGGKEISYNNILDIDAAVSLIDEFAETENVIAILKHNNACGVAVRNTLLEAWKDALAGDPVSAFGGIIITNQKIDLDTAKEIDKLFYEVLIAPEYSEAALELLIKKSKRILMKRKPCKLPQWQFRTALNGVLVQEKDRVITSRNSWKVVSNKQPSESEISDLLFANKIVKHTKSNTIVLAHNKQLIGSGTGQTSRVDALKQAIDKAKSFGLDLQGAVMASDAFFPFADSVEIACKEGIKAVIQPGGSIKDQESVDYCNNHDMSMIMTGIRHFKH